MSSFGDNFDLLAELGFDGLDDQLSEEKPPVPVDEQCLRDYFNRKLPEAEREEVVWLLSTFRAWHEAGLRVAKQMAQERRTVERVSAWLLLKSLLQRKQLMLATAALLLVTGAIYWLSPPATMTLRDGGSLVAMKDGSVIGLEQFGDKWNNLAFKALDSGSLPEPKSRDQLFLGQPVLRGDARSAVIDMPYSTAVGDREPKFEWHSATGAQTYEVFIYDESNLEQPVLRSGSLTGRTSWKSTEKLQPGQIYRWYIVVTTTDGEYQFPQATEMPARFLVLPPTALDRVQAAEQELEGSHLLLCLLYVEEGLFDEARLQLRMLQTLNPKASVLDEIEQRLNSMQWNKSNQPVENDDPTEK